MHITLNKRCFFISKIQGYPKKQGCIKLPFPPPRPRGDRIKLLGKKIKWGRRKGEGKKKGKGREEWKGKQ